MDAITQQLATIRRQEEEGQTRVVAKRVGLPYIDLVGYPIAEPVLVMIGLKEARHWQLIPYRLVGKTLSVATARLPNKELNQFLDQVSRQKNLTIKLALCSRSSFELALRSHELKVWQKAKRQLAIEPSRPTDYQAIIKSLWDVGEQLKKTSTTELIDLIFAGAVINEASDIHVEPEAEGARLRFRIDGVLEDVTRLSLEQYKALRSRIKFLSQMKLDVTGKPQDGRFDFTSVGKHIDARVSTLPGVYGEAMVIRLLITVGHLRTLAELGFSTEAMKVIEQAIAKPHGMIINTGPTGSGKTTTLYAILQALNRPGVKIITIEDPIEYRLAGIEQTQVDPPKGYGYQTALRSVLRQDPDIIMIGEIRDPETARLALQASITGHLVLTTLHTNSVAATIPRLLDMGVQEYLLAGSINLIIAQRLVRKLCQGDDCPPNRPFKGRLPIVELIVPSHDFNELIARHGTIEEFEERAKQLGMKTMYEDGLEKVRQGLTTQAELERLASENA